MEKRAKRLFYIEYTFLFLLISGLVLFFYYSNGKTMIDAGGDGFRQHFRALLYYSEYLKKLFANLLHGRFVIPQWDFVIGEGSDVLRTFHYYCIGDPFTFLSVLCPKEYMHLYYDGATIARLYCAGLSFSALCLYKNKDRIISLGVSLLYAFCPFCLSGMSGHVFFISAAVFLPLIILGVEKILNGDEPYLLSIAVMFSSLSNIYFFYMNVVSTIIFTLVRLISMKVSLQEKGLYLFKVGIFSIIGLMMSFVIFLPMANVLLGSNRLDSEVNVGFFYSLQEYLYMFKGMTYEDSSYLGGYSVFWPFGLSCLFLKKKNKVLIALVIIAFLFVNLPYLSKIYNAMTYPTNRWCYAVSMLMLYIIVDSFDDVGQIESLFAVNAGIIIAYYALTLYLNRSYWQVTALFFLISLLILFAFRLFKNRKTVLKYVCLGVIVFSLLFEVYYCYSFRYWGRYRLGTDISTIEQMKNDEYSIFDQIDDSSFFRYGGNSLAINESVQGDRSSTQFYWSIANDSVVEFRKLTALSDKSNHHFNNYDQRFALNALSGVKYFVWDEKGVIPFGFEYLSDYGEYKVYKSSYSLPLLYAYDNYMLADNWNLLSAIKRNEALLQTAVVEKDLSIVDSTDIKFESLSIPYDMSYTEGISIDEDEIKVESPMAEVYLECHSERLGEYYLAVEGIHSDVSVSNIGIQYENVDKLLIFKGNDNQHYTDRHDYLINLGYMDGLDGTVTMTFPDAGIFTYDKIQILCQPLEHQIKSLDKIKEIDINDLHFSENKVTASLSVSDNRFVCFSIPYSKGWKAFVDGKETELYKCNVQYLGVELEAGEHLIELKYSSPYLRIGALISFCGFVILTGLLFKGKNKPVQKDV